MLRVVCRNRNQLRACSEMTKFKVQRDLSGEVEVWDVTARAGERLHLALKENGVDVELSCGGQQACSTCHIILPDSVFDSVTPAEEAEEDMLDIAADHNDNSRLACCLKVVPELEGETLILPANVEDFWN